MTRSRGLNPMRALRGSLEDRYWAQVDTWGQCWGWDGATDRFGYGVLGNGGRGAGIIKAHRVSWELNYGPVPVGFCVLHHCDNPPCTKPEHLWIGTRADNNRDMREKGRGSKPPNRWAT